MEHRCFRCHQSPDALLLVDMGQETVCVCAECLGLRPANQETLSQVVRVFIERERMRGEGAA